MTITVTPDARRAIADWLSRDPSRPALRLAFAGGCGALGFRLSPAPSGSRPGEQVLTVDGLTIYVDFKAANDLDGARLEMGDSPDDILLIHDQCIVGGMC